MRRVRLATCSLSLFLMVSSLPARGRKIVVLGSLIRVDAIGGESTGWRIDLNSVITVDGKQIRSIEVKASNTKRLEALENKTVEAKGRLTYATGMTGERPVLDHASLKGFKQKKEEGSLLDAIVFFLESLAR